MQEGLVRLGSLVWEVPIGFVPGMRVPGRIYLSEALMSSLEDGAVRQLANVATMPGIVSHALAMPDIHWGYGFPIGGVAAFSMEDGVISPGGVGFDINCGVRLMGTPLVRKDLGDVRGLLEELYRAVPTGVGAKSSLRLSGQALDAMMVQGSSWAEQEGYGLPADIRRCEDAGAMAGADPAAVSQKAKQRGMPQAGTLGAGNHFLEVQEVKEVYDPAAAAAFGVREGQVCVMVHCGSRGLGHQVCTDHLLTLERAVKKYQIALSDRQLACAPLSSPEGKAYYGAMAAAANYAWANRQLIMHNTRDVLRRLYHIPHEEMPLIYDVAHNVAKMEEHEVEGHRVRLCVHRKGATRAFGPGREEVAAEFRETGQPVIIPGSMGTSSFLLKGTAHAMAATFGSTCHGAGRLLSRTAAKKEISGREVTESLARNGIVVKAPHPGAIAEEAPAAYKSSAEVVRVVHESGISLLVARLEPIGVIKG